MQERTDIQQQHLAAFAAGSLDVPELQGGSRRAALLRDAQTFLTTTAQVPCTHCLHTVMTQGLEA